MIPFERLLAVAGVVEIFEGAEVAEKEGIMDIGESLEQTCRPMLNEWFTGNKTPRDARKSIIN